MESNICDQLKDEEHVNKQYFEVTNEGKSFVE